MKWIPSGVGADPKKLAILGGLVVVLGVVYFLNRADSPASANPSANPAAQTVPRPGAQPAPNQIASRGIDSVTPMPPQRTQRGSEPMIQDFKPSLKPPDGTDVSRIDPTLRLDLVSKLRTLPLEGGERSIFDFGAPPKPKTPPPAVQPIKPVTPMPANVATPAAPVAPAKPLPPPIPLKFYGYVDASLGSTRQAFFLEGDDIFVAGENDVIHGRYKIVRINANSAVVEDTTTKNQQTLPLVEELPG